MHYLQYIFVLDRVWYSMQKFCKREQLNSNKNIDTFLTVERIKLILFLILMQGKVVEWLREVLATCQLPVASYELPVATC